MRFHEQGDEEEEGEVAHLHKANIWLSSSIILWASEAKPNLNKYSCGRISSSISGDAVDAQNRPFDRYFFLILSYVGLLFAAPRNKYKFLSRPAN